MDQEILNDNGMPEDVQAPPPPQVQTVPVANPTGLNQPPVAANSPAPNFATTPAPTPQVQPPAQPDQHGVGAMLGHAFKSLLSGTDTSYTRDDSGTLVAVQTPSKPGALARRILAASVLSGAESAGQPSFFRGLVTGAGGAVNRSNEQDQLARQRADHDFEMRQKAAQGQREQGRYQIEQDRAAQQKELFAGQLAVNNWQKLQALKAIQGLDIADHDSLAKQGSGFAQQYKDAGILPALRVSESEKEQVLKNDPALSKYDWQPVENQIKIDPKTGAVSHELVYEAFDPNATTKLTDAAAGNYKKVGLSEITGADGNTVKLTPGMTLTPKQNQYLQSQFNQKYPQYHQQQVDALNVEKEKSTIDNIKSEIGLHKAEAGRANRESAAYKKLEDQDNSMKAFDEAREKLGLEQGFSSLNSKQQRSVLDGLDKTFTETNTKINNIVHEQENLQKQMADAGPERKKDIEKSLTDLYRQKNDYEVTVSAINRLKQKGLRITPNAEEPKPPAPGTPITDAALGWYASQYGGDKNKIKAAAQAAGWAPSAPATGNAATATAKNTAEFDQAERARLDSVQEVQRVSGIEAKYRPQIDAAVQAGDLRKAAQLREYEQYEKDRKTPPIPSGNAKVGNLR